MSADTTIDLDTLERRDWRVWFGLASMVFWLWLGFLYINANVGWGHFARQPADALGSFLEGAFAPLAFLWLVIGFFLQQRQLSENTLAIQRQYEALRRTAEQAEIQSRAIAANELHARQDTFIDVAHMVSNQLGVITGYLWMSSQGEGTPDEQIAELWTDFGQGDHTTFSRKMISLVYGDQSTREELFWSTEIRTRHSTHFMATFERLIESAEGCDPNGMIADALRADVHGRIYEFIAMSRPGKPA